MKDTSFYNRSSPRTRGPSLCPLNVRAIWQSLDSRVRGNERMWRFPHALDDGRERLSVWSVWRSGKRLGKRRGSDAQFAVPDAPKQRLVEPHERAAPGVIEIDR